MDMGHRGEGVDHHGAARRPLDDDGKSVPQVRLPQQFDLGPQMGDEHTNGRLSDPCVRGLAEDASCSVMLRSQRAVAPMRPLAPGGRRDAHVRYCSDRRGAREYRDWPARGAAAGVRRIHPGRALWASGEAGARRGRDDPGDPTQAQRGGGNVGRERRGPAHRRRRIFLAIGGQATRQAPQESRRIVCRQLTSQRVLLLRGNR